MGTITKDIVTSAIKVVPMVTIITLLIKNVLGTNLSIVTIMRVSKVILI